MALKASIPFEKILIVVKTLTPPQKAKLKEELCDKSKKAKKLPNFTAMLLKGPLFTKKQIAIIEENRKSIAAWRTKK